MAPRGNPGKLFPRPGRKLSLEGRIPKAPWENKVPETSLATRDGYSSGHSGTEPVIRVMIEGEDQDMIQEMAEELKALIEQRLG